jgi:hypothetical protein
MDAGEPIRKIGTGSLGGKAHGLTNIHEILDMKLNRDAFPEIQVTIPDMVILQTDIFSKFMENNNLYDIAYSDLADDRIALAFQQGDLPFEVLGDLRALISRVHTPLAIRSSSLLEDATYEPFAGVYATKMIPNNQFDTNTRYRKLVEAIKFVYASTFFQNAKNYMRATNHSIEEEKMAVIIQEEVGNKHGERFYPELSGVARSFNFYPMGRAKHEDGVVHLALGLGKTIVDGGISWSYSPSYPKVEPPYSKVEDLLKIGQTKFWAVNMGEPLEYNPIEETEYLLHKDITAAEMDGTLRYLASTYDPYSRGISVGIGKTGPRVLTFAPILVLEEVPINNLIKSLLSICEEALEGPVEIEFAVTFNPHRFGFLQVRRMVIFDEEIELSDAEFGTDNILLASDNVLGNGISKNIQDIVYVKPEMFESRYLRSIAMELPEINKILVDEGNPYMLIVFGRLGTTDPWLGIPINFGQIAGAKTVVETTLKDFNVTLSQGSHYFHNLTSMSVKYFSVPFASEYKIDWEWLNDQEAAWETDLLRHVRLNTPLTIKVDGRSGKGVVLKPQG